eukprot:TRINITY_DN33487_c0_g1_i1.p2 TRINITY_DN33487_c0_g1~~TRINITY_DN33487_c0_g1_i1.p2  ORF type:complete len:129 (+),score=29.61 TRINITY_DN33487_c0_g1_i1:42-428(+)
MGAPPRGCAPGQCGGDATPFYVILILGLVLIVCGFCAMICYCCYSAGEEIQEELDGSPQVGFPDPEFPDLVPDLNFPQHLSPHRMSPQHLSPHRMSPHHHHGHHGHSSTMHDARQAMNLVQQGRRMMR